MTTVDKNGLRQLPDLIEIDLRAAFDHDRHSDDGCPLNVDVESDIVSEAEREMVKLAHDLGGLLEEIWKK